MGEYDRRHSTKIFVDEWGSWHKPGTQLKPTHLLGQQNTMRDALVASVSLDIFNRNADKVAMANIAQLVNCLQSLFLADGDKFITTPTYHVFDMFTPHMGANAVGAVFSSPNVSYDRNGKPASIFGLNGSASVSGKDITLTVTNTHLSESNEAEITIRSGRIASAKARVLSTTDVHAHNTFDQPNAVVPHDEPVKVAGDMIAFRFPPASVTQIQITMQ